MTSSLLDSYNRKIDYMRISVTDRCNLRCIYCTSSRFQNLSHEDILRYEEIERVVRAAAGLGVKSIRLTGGEPMVRPHIATLIGMIAEVPGIEDISMTTNGTLLSRHGHAREFKGAGLKRVNISLDTFKPERFACICQEARLENVLDGIEVAKEAGLDPVKINTVIMRGINDDEILDFARKSITDSWHVRYIEEMPLTGQENAQKMVSINDIQGAIETNLGKLEPAGHTKGNGPARYYRLPRAEGTIGFIGPVTHSFCDTCNRFRLTADGKLRPCLLRDDEVDIRAALRNGASIAELQAMMLSAAHLKKEKHDLTEKVGALERQMWQIGG